MTANRNTARQGLILTIASAISLVAAESACLAFDAPAFRGGLWKFERTIETDGKPSDRLQTSGLPIAREVTRCVNPTSALKAEFTALPIGSCRVNDVQKTDGGFTLQRTCGGGTPIKVEVDVKNDSAYTEVHQGGIGKLFSRETVVAQRVGDCQRRG